MSLFSNDVLLSPNFDDVAYLQYLLHTGGYQNEEEMRRLQSCLETLKGEMAQLIQEHQDDVVLHTQTTYRAQEDLSAVRQSAESLAKAKERLRLMIEGPHASIQTHLTELENTNKVMEILRDVNRFLGLMKKLGEAAATSSPSTPTLGGGSHMSVSSSSAALLLLQQARTIMEIESLLTTADVRSIKVVEDQIPAYERAAAQVRSTITNLLKMSALLQQDSGVHAPAIEDGGDAAGGGRGSAVVGATSTASAASNAVVADVGLSLMCSYVLGTLHSTALQFMNEKKVAVLRAVGRELQLSAVQQCAKRIQEEQEQSAKSSSAGKAAAPVGTVSGSGLPVLQEAILRQLRVTLRFTIRQTQCVLAFWRVLLSKSDPITSKPYLAAVLQQGEPGSRDPAQMVADYLVSLLNKYREMMLQLQEHFDETDGWSRIYTPYMSLLYQFLGTGRWAGGLAVGPSYLTTLSREGWGCGFADCVDLLEAVDSEVAALQHRPTQTQSRTALKRIQPGTSINTGRTAGASASSPSGFRYSALRERFFSGWLSDMSKLIRQKRLKQTVSHQRELLKPVFSQFYALLEAAQSQPSATALTFLNSVARTAPTSGAPASSLVQPFDCEMGVLYVKQLQQDLAKQRHDAHAMSVWVYAILHVVHQWRQAWEVARRRFTLPPQPAVTSTMTRAQLVHLCIANMCTSVLEGLLEVLRDMGPILSFARPAAGGSAGGAVVRDGAGASVEGGSDDTPLEYDEEVVQGVPLLREMLGESAMAAAEALAGCSIEGQLQCERVVLGEFCEYVRRLQSDCALPFLESGVGLAEEWLPRCFSEEVEVATRREESLLHATRSSPPSTTTGYPNATTMLPQLQRLIEHFRSQFYVAVNPRNSAWRLSSRLAVDSLLCRLLTHALLLPLPPLEISPTALLVGRSAVQQELKLLTSLLPALADHLRLCGATRSTIVLEGAAKQLELLYSTLYTDRWSVLQPPSPAPLAPAPGFPPTIVTPESPSPPSAHQGTFDVLVSVLQGLNPLLSSLFLLQQAHWEMQAVPQQQPQSPTGQTDGWPASLQRVLTTGKDGSGASPASTPNSPTTPSTHRNEMAQVLVHHALLDSASASSIGALASPRSPFHSSDGSLRRYPHPSAETAVDTATTTRYSAMDTCRDLHDGLCQLYAELRPRISLQSSLSLLWEAVMNDVDQHHPSHTPTFTTAPDQEYKGIV